MSSTSEKKRRIRGTLSREQVLAGALDLIDEEGLEGLTMRRLAERLGCGTMSLYSHVADRDDLVAGIVALVIERMDLHYIAGESWQDCARRTVEEYRALAHEHPAAFELLALADNDVEPVAPYLEHLLWLFRKGGLREEAARAFLSVADGFTSGMLLYESRAVARHRNERLSPDERARERAYLAQLHARDAFDLGFDVIIRGIEAAFPESVGEGRGDGEGPA